MFGTATLAPDLPAQFRLERGVLGTYECQFTLATAALPPVTMIGNSSNDLFVSRLKHVCKILTASHSLPIPNCLERDPQFKVVQEIGVSLATHALLELRQENHLHNLLRSWLVASRAFDAVLTRAGELVLGAINADLFSDRQVSRDARDFIASMLDDERRPRLHIEILEEALVAAGLSDDVKLASQGLLKTPSLASSVRESLDFFARLRFADLSSVLGFIAITEFPLGVDDALLAEQIDRNWGAKYSPFVEFLRLHDIADNKQGLGGAEPHAVLVARMIENLQAGGHLDINALVSVMVEAQNRQLAVFDEGVNYPSILSLAEKQA